ncbi:MAG: alpha/beta hydrolase, partial [Solobacterium sp.]|nr:alpha/beta hydrolase [Solobacterium sp.]
MAISIRNGSVKLAGTEMYYARFGHGDRNLVVLPGLSDGLSTVKGLAMVLAAPYRKHFDSHTIYMFSRKNAMPEGYSIKDMAADQLTALRQLGIDQTSVLGVSQGGMIAQYIAILAPQMTERLVLAATAPDCSEMAREKVLHWLELVGKKDHKQLMIDTAECSYSPAYLARYRKVYPLLGLAAKPKTYERF